MGASEEVSRKNSAAFSEAIKALQVQLHAQAEAIALAQANMSTMSRRITDLERQVMIQRAMSHGSGPSVAP